MGSQSSNRALAEALKRTMHGDTEAFGEIIAHYQAMAFACAYTVLHDRSDSEDAVQEAFLTAFSRLADLRDPIYFGGWLRRIVLSSCARIARRPKFPTLPIEAAAYVTSPDNDPETHIERYERRAELARALATLNPADRMAVTLYYIGGYTTAQVADFLEIPQGTVKYRLHVARKLLKERMVAEMREDLTAARPGDELRQRILDTLLARSARFDDWVAQYYADNANVEPDRVWAERWHERRIVDVRANARQYGITPNENLPRMLPEYQATNTYRDDFTDIPNRWGVPRGTSVVCLRDLCRTLRVTPLALHRWEADGLPVLRYSPWAAYDAERAAEWVRRRDVREDERMTPEQAREPVLLLLRAVASGSATEAEALSVYHALAAVRVADPSRRLDPLWESEWMNRRPAERQENSRHYGLRAPTPSWLGKPENTVVREIRDLCRRLGLSPFDVIHWTHEGMPALRESPYVYWDEDHVARWLADKQRLPDRDYTEKEMDVVEQFVIGAVARGEGSPETAREILASWFGVM